MDIIERLAPNNRKAFLAYMEATGATDAIKEIIQDEWLDYIAAEKMGACDA